MDSKTVYRKGDVGVVYISSNKSSFFQVDFNFGAVSFPYEVYSDLIMRGGDELRACLMKFGVGNIGVLEKVANVLESVRKDIEEEIVQRCRLCS